MSLQINRAEKSAGDFSQPLVRRAGPLLVLLAVALVFWTYLDWGFLPSDDGTLAHAASRVRSGEIPHVDFDTPYTGGLTFLNAFVFSVLGEDLVVLRYPFFGLFLLWILVFWDLARAYLDDMTAAVFVGGLAFGSVFMNLTPSPTWYNLFLGTLALWASIRFLRHGTWRWLVLAGLLLGVSVLAKTTGAYIAVGVGLLAAGGPTIRASAESWLRKAFLAASVLAVAGLAMSIPSASRVVILLIPMATVVWLEWRRPIDTGPAQHGTMIFRVAILTAAFVLPIAFFVLFYASLGGVDDLVASVTTVPSLFIETVSQDLLPLFFGVVVVVVARIVVVMARLPGSQRLTGAAVIAAAMTLWYVASAFSILRTVYVAISFLPPVLAFAYFWRVRARYSKGTALRYPSVEVFGLVVAALVFQLVRFPTSNQYYTMYGFPLLALAMVAVLSGIDRNLAKTAAMAVVVVGVLFGFARIDGTIFASAVWGQRVEYVRLDIPRGGLRVPEHFAYYNQMIPMLAEPDMDDGDLLAGPDSPEVYFLAGIPNQTPILFDLITDSLRPGVTTPSAYLKLSPDVVVLNRSPIISDRPDDLEAELIGDCRLVAEHGLYAVFGSCRDS